MPTPDTEFVGQLNRSQIYRDYERAFAMATGLPLTLRASDGWSLSQRGPRNENPFCALMAQSGKGCSICLELQENIRKSQTSGALPIVCFAGLCDTAVPVWIGQKLVGYLHTGQVALQKPTAAKFRKIVKTLMERGVDIDLRKLKDAYFHSRVIQPKQYAGVIRLLEIFAAHLGVIGNQLMIQESSAESPFTRRAKAYVTDHQNDPISLNDVSHALHVSTFYFCKMFKKATGLTFTDYLGRVRIERAKTMLLNPNRRISEVAYEVGFGSLTHFNRIFRRLVGKSPSDYRLGVPHL
jgi:AraC-like DNA-binding protein/ligand-binding sensor protein